jgi:hypothetical protein
MKTKITILAVVLALAGCETPRQTDYNRFKSQFLPEVFESFPELDIKSPEMAIGSLAGYEILGYVRFNALYEYADEESFAKALSDIEKNAIAIYNSFDTCLVSVYKMEDTIYNCENSYCPIYNDYNMSSMFTAAPDRNQILSDTVQYYVFNCKEGWYIKDNSLKNLVGKKTNYLRKKTYQHGFSIGAIVDRKKQKIAYWVFVW